MSMSEDELATADRDALIAEVRRLKQQVGKSNAGVIALENLLARMGYDAPHLWDATEGNRLTMRIPDGSEYHVYVVAAALAASAPGLATKENPHVRNG